MRVGMDFNPSGKGLFARSRRSRRTSRCLTSIGSWSHLAFAAFSCLTCGRSAAFCGSRTVRAASCEYHTNDCEQSQNCRYSLHLLLISPLGNAAPKRVGQRPYISRNFIKRECLAPVEVKNSSELPYFLSLLWEFEGYNQPATLQKRSKNG